MAPKPKFTREQIVDTAVNVIRDSCAEAITAQEIARRLGTSTRPVFTYFNTLTELRAAAVQRARELYNACAERGLAMSPAFKGYGMAYIRFATEEPSLFRLLFMQKTEQAHLLDYIDQEGHLPAVRQAVMDAFQLDPPQADWLYENMWVFAHGMAALCASGAVRFTEEEIAEKLGMMCRSLLIALHMPADSRTEIVPGKDVAMPGSAASYMHPDTSAKP